jgi:hypothetical protein
MLAAACVKIPEFQARDGSLGDGQGNGDDQMLTPNAVTVMMNGEGATATLPGLYELEFSADAYHFPFNWGIGPANPLTQVLYSPSDTACTLERDFGVAYLPAHVLASVPTGGASAGSGTLTIIVPGPGVAKVRLDWSASLMCGAMPNGWTTFSLFPDGRISRMDIARMPAAANGNDCDCAGDNDWRVYGYAAFSRGVIADVQGMAYPSPADPVGTAVTNIACIEGNNNAFRIGVGWKNTRGNRLRSPDGMSFALLGDLVTSMQTIGGGADNGLFGDSTTTYWPSLTASCTALRNQVMPFTQDPQLDFDDGNGAFGMGQDGIFGGETAFGQPGRNTGGSTVTVRPLSAIPPFALWLEFGVFAHDTPPILSKTPSTPTMPWYTVQRPTATQYLFWFPDGLAANERIMIRSE